MLPLTICTLLVTLCVANGLTSHVHKKSPESQHSEPLSISKNDYDSIGLPGPDYKFSYMFEQDRTDEVPQVDKIEEKIGKYMSYIPKTTTTTTKPLQDINSFNENFDELTKAHGVFQSPIIVLEKHHKHHHHHIVENITPTTIKVEVPTSAPKIEEPRYEEHPHFSTHNSNNWNDQSAYPAKKPSAPFIPKWGELNRALKQHPHPRFPAHFVPLNHHGHPKHHHHHHHHQVNFSSKTSETPVKAAEHKKHVFIGGNIYPPSSTQEPLSPSRLDSDALVEVKPDEINDFVLRRAPQHMYRGRYKFQWDDFNDMRTHTSAVSTTTLATVRKSQGKASPPPPVPTLSPWYDGYGK